MLKRNTNIADPLLRRAGRLAAEAGRLTASDAASEEGRRQVIRVLAELQIVRDLMIEEKDRLGDEIEAHGRRVSAIRSYRRMSRVGRAGALH